MTADLATLRIGFIGAGRLGKALAWSLSGRGLNVVAVASQSRASAEGLANAISGCKVVSPQEVVDTSDLVFVTTSDGAIATAVAQAHWRSGVSVVHCSGVTEVSALGKAAHEGAIIGGFHPMQTFGDPAVAVHSLPGCTITIEAQEPLDALLVALAGHLECNVNRLPPGMRARYHAAAGFPSQFINVLFAQASTLWQSWGATEEDAVRAVLPMARGTLASIASAGIAGGMPGPVSRGDVQSVEQHVAALLQFRAQQSEAGLADAATLELYRHLCEGTIVLALQRGVIDAATAARFREALRKT